MDEQLNEGLSLDLHVSEVSGETVYTVCDSVGVVFTTIFPARLAPFYRTA